MQIDWNAAGVIVTGAGLVVSIAALAPTIALRTRLRRRLLHALELLAALPEHGHDALRGALRQTVDLTSARLVRLERRWLRRQDPFIDPTWELPLFLVILAVTAAVKVIDVYFKAESWAAPAIAVAILIVGPTTLVMVMNVALRAFRLIASIRAREPKPADAALTANDAAKTAARAEALDAGGHSHHGGAGTA